MSETFTMWNIGCLLILMVTMTYSHVKGQEKVAPPNFKNMYEDKTDKTMDQLISESVGGIGVAAHMMMAPGSMILAELDMYLDTDQFLQLYEPPQAMDMIKRGLMAAPVGTTYDEERENFYEAVKAIDAKKSRKKRKATRNASTRWPKAEMPYLFAKGHFASKEEYMMRRAMTEWERYTCIKFRAATGADRDYVRFQNGAGCNSQLGMVTGIQVLNLQAPGCRYKGLYLHEIGHALGLVHEHQLPNRDKYIDILYHNVSPHMRIWFNKYTSAQVNQMNVPYQLSSVMHYGVTAFAKDGSSQTIRAKDQSKEETIGKVYLKELAYTDVMIVNKMYSCSSKCPNQNKCGSKGHLDQNCNCICLDGSDDCDTTRKTTPNPKCKNNYDSWSCYIWANQGECERNPGYMNKNCAKACGSCGDVKQNSDACKDVYESSRCMVWKGRGDCLTNGRWMEDNCKATCQYCSGRNTDRPETACKDLYNEVEKCDEWAKAGECEVNREWMKSNCPKSCFLCNDDGKGVDKNDTTTGGTTDEDKLECVDTHDNCQTWSKNGECSANPGWMINNCRKACKKCEDKTCKNLYDDVQCQIWEQKLECMTNSEWMAVHCSRSCLTGLCKNETQGTTKSPSGTTTPTMKPTVEPACQNLHKSDTECEIWAKNDHCNINPEWMNKYCMKSCAACQAVEGGRTTTATSSTTTSGRTNVCKDDNKNCPAWAKHGFCDISPRYNLIYCKKSCNNCNGCRDEEFLCEVWAKAGHCINNARYMLRQCQKSCTACLMTEELDGLQPVEPHEGGANKTNGTKEGDSKTTGTDGDTTSGATPLLMTSYLTIVCGVIFAQCFNFTKALRIGFEMIV